MTCGGASRANLPQHAIVPPWIPDAPGEVRKVTTLDICSGVVSRL
jgi:hypothetical protein